MKKLILRLFRALIRHLPLSARSAFTIELLQSFIEKSENSRAALVRLLEIDNILYACTSKAARMSHGGEHPKHRLLDYASFFIAHVVDGDTVIDLGCGDGYVALNVAKNHPDSQVFGIDHNPVSIETAKGKNYLPNLEFILGDIFHDIPERKFDKIILSNVLEHIEHRPEFLKKVIGSSGAREVLIRVPMFNRDWRVPLKKELGIESRLDDTHFTEFTVESFQEEMAEAGLKITHLEIRWSEIWSHLEVT